MNARRLRLGVIAAGTALGLGGGGVALATNSGSRPAASISLPAEDVGSPASQIPPTLLSNFAVLSDRSLPGAPSPELISTNGPQTASMGLNPALAKRVESDGATVYVVPGSAGICIYVPVSTSSVRGVQSGCTSIANAENGNLQISLVSPGDGEAEVFGLAPNGAQTVTVNNIGGGTSSVPIVDNVYRVSDRSAESVSVPNATGATHAVEVIH